MKHLVVPIFSVLQQQNQQLQFQMQDVSTGYIDDEKLKWVIIPCSQYAILNLNPSPKSNQIFNPSKSKHEK